MEDKKNENWKLFESLENIVWYNGHYEWLKELRDELMKHLNEHHYSMPDEIEWGTEMHVLWMLLVGMFGDWGISVRSGWLEDIESCIEFIDALCKESWEADDGK